VWRAAWAVVIVDVGLKFYVPTRPFARHEVVPPSVAGTLALLVVLGAFVLWRPSPWGAMLLAGIACNRLDALDGVVQNPIAVKLENGMYWSFNPADIAIQVGGAVAVTQTLWALGTWLLRGRVSVDAWTEGPRKPDAVRVRRHRR